MDSLIDTETASQRIADHLPEVPEIDCPLTKCAGRILRQSVKADRPLPPYDRATMDGYALRSEEATEAAEFRITDHAPAGSPRRTLGAAAQSCIEIMTGAILPDGANCVIPYEATERMSASAMRLAADVRPSVGESVHPEGSDCAQGHPLLAEGRLLGGREIAVAASCGYASLRVGKNPAIAIASTGDELVAVEARPATHQIRRSNDMAVETSLASVQLHARVRTHLPDETGAARNGLTALVEQNRFVILSGGVSMGQKDFVPDLLDELGLTRHFHGVAQKPGKPMGFWSNGKCAVLALPGNPLSTLTCLHHYVIPGIRKAAGLRSVPAPRTVTVSATTPVPEHLTVFLPVALEADNRAIPRPPQNSGDLVSILQSDGYIEVPSGQAEALAGIDYPFQAWH